jgi:hypothetical protein
MKPHRGTVVLVLGILSLVICGIILGPIAWIMGNSDLKEMREGRMDPSGESNTKAGRMCGMIGTGLNLVGLCICTPVWLLLVGTMGRNANQTFEFISTKVSTSS